MNSAIIHSPRQCRVTCEASPQSLGRIYALLTLLNLVPAQTSSNDDGHGCINLDICFDSVSERHFDLLLRKIAQLTETIYVAETRRPEQAAKKERRQAAR